MVFAVRRTRAATVLTELLTGAFTGVLVCDRAKMYWGLGRLQWCWVRCRDGSISRGELSRCLAPTRRAVEALLLRGLFSGHPRLVGMCRELYEHRQRLWTFLGQEVEPTNNASDRALRQAVIWRKLSFGTQSAGAAGSWRRC